MRAHLLPVLLTTLLATAAHAQTPLQQAALATVSAVVNLGNTPAQAPQQGQLKDLLAQTVLVDSKPMPRWDLIQMLTENARPELILSFEQMRGVADCDETAGTCTIYGQIQLRRPAGPNQPEDVAYLSQVYGVTCRNLAAGKADDCILTRFD